MSFACLYVPDFSVQAATRSEGPNVRNSSLAVLDGPESLLTVFACNRKARSCGVEVGMTRLQSETFPNLLLRKRQSALEESAQTALLDCGHSFSPRVESTAPGTVTIDISGTERLWGTQQTIGQELARRCRSCGFDVHIGIAGNPDAALCAARGFDGISVIDPGEETVRLASLSIEVLQPTKVILDVFDSWGIRTFQSLASLPPVPLVERLGQEGLYLQRLARGQVERELVSLESPPRFAEYMELEEPVELLEPLAFVLNRLLEQITARLVTWSMGTDHIQLELELEIHADRQASADAFASPRGQYQRFLKLPVPTQDSRLLLKLLQLDLAAHPPPGPVRKISLTAEPARIRSTQTGLFQPLSPEPGRLEIALARLRAVVGERDEMGRSRVGAPSIVDSYYPDSFEVEPFRGDISAEVRKCPPPSRLALRLFRPPIAARVDVKGTPRVVAFDGTRSDVMDCAGPWRSCGQWWDRAGKWQRDEWDVVLNIDGGFGLYRLVRDLSSAEWFVEGIYD